MTLSATCVPLSAAVNPLGPTAAAMIMLGVMEIERVINRRNQGAHVQLREPSLTIWPAIVATMPAEVPLSRRAKAKIVPAIGAMVEDSKSCMPKRSAVGAELLFESEAPAVMRMALLMKRANVKRAITSSMME